MRKNDLNKAAVSNDDKEEYYTLKVLDNLDKSMAYLARRFRWKGLPETQ